MYEHRGDVKPRFSLINLTAEGETSDAFFAGAFAYGSFVLLADPDEGSGTIGSATVELEISVDGENWANPDYFYGPHLYMSAGRAALMNVDLRGVYAVRFKVSKADGDADAKAQVRAFMQHMG